MTNQLQAPPAATEFVMADGHTYHPGEDGIIDVADPEHVRPLRALGCTLPGCNATQISTVEEVPTDSHELVQENVLLKQQVRALTDQLNETQGLLTEAAKVEDTLRDRIQELEGIVAGLRTASGTQESAEEASDSSGASQASGDTSPGQDGPIKPVDGVLVSAAEAFDDLEYNALKEWLKVHGVHFPANGKKVDAIAACKARFAELTANKE